MKGLQFELHQQQGRPAVRFPVADILGPGEGRTVTAKPAAGLTNQLTITKRHRK